MQQLDQFRQALGESEATLAAATMVTADEATAAAFVAKLGAFRGSLGDDERRLFDGLLASASLGSGDVEAYGLTGLGARQVALAAVMLLGVTAATLGPAASGTAFAAPSESPSLNNNMGGSSMGSAPRSGGSTGGSNMSGSTMTGGSTASSNTSGTSGSGARGPSVGGTVTGGGTTAGSSGGGTMSGSSTGSGSLPTPPGMGNSPAHPPHAPGSNTIIIDVPSSRVTTQQNGPGGVVVRGAINNPDPFLEAIRQAEAEQAAAAAAAAQAAAAQAAIDARAAAERDRLRQQAAAEEAARQQAAAQEAERLRQQADAQAAAERERARQAAVAAELERQQQAAAAAEQQRQAEAQAAQQAAAQQAAAQQAAAEQAAAQQRQQQAQANLPPLPNLPPVQPHDPGPRGPDERDSQYQGRLDAAAQQARQQYDTLNHQRDVAQNLIDMHTRTHGANAPETERARQIFDRVDTQARQAEDIAHSRQSRAEGWALGGTQAREARVDPNATRDDIGETVGEIEASRQGAADAGARSREIVNNAQPPAVRWLGGGRDQ